MSNPLGEITGSPPLESWEKEPRDHRSSNEVACNCSATPPTMPTYRKHHLPTCPCWVIENAANVQQRVAEPVTLRSNQLFTRDEWTMQGQLYLRPGQDVPFTSRWVRAEWADAEIKRLTEERNDAVARSMVRLGWGGENTKLRAALNDALAYTEHGPDDSMPTLRKQLNQVARVCGQALRVTDETTGEQG